MRDLNREGLQQLLDLIVAGHLYQTVANILEVLKTASRDEVAMRTQLLKERQCGGDSRAEREEI